jgi:hypothetical protein
VEWNFLVRDRKINPDTIRRFDFRYWPGRDVVVMPVRNMYKKLLAAPVRSIRTKAFYFLNEKVTNIPELVFPSMKQTGVFFGEDLVDYQKPVLLVESPLEACRVSSLGFKNVVACCEGINGGQLNRITMWDRIFLGFDADPAGKKSTSKIINRHKQTIRMRVVDWWSVGVTDPGELTDYDQLRKALKRASWA